MLKQLLLHKLFEILSDVYGGPYDPKGVYTTSSAYNNSLLRWNNKRWRPVYNYITSAWNVNTDHAPVDSIELSEIQPTIVGMTDAQLLELYTLVIHRSVIQM